MAGVEDVKILGAGSCTGLEYITITSGKFEHIDIPNTFALIKHSTQGYILFDTGYTHRFFEETKQFPYSIYAALTPVTVPKNSSAKEQLQDKFGIPAEQVKFVIISHFHADHVAGLRDFPNAKFVYFKSGFDLLKPLMQSPLQAVMNAFIPALLPADFEQRSWAIDDTIVEKNQQQQQQQEANGAPQGSGALKKKLPAAYAPFEEGYDLFGDDSIIVVSLPGHTKGHLGAFVTQGAGGNRYLFVGDACWNSKSFQGEEPPSSSSASLWDSIMPKCCCSKHSQIIPPSRVTGIMVHHDWEEYLRTLKKLHKYYKAHPETTIVPSHCPQIFAKFVNTTTQQNSKM